MQSKTIINFAFLILSLAVSFESVYANDKAAPYQITFAQNAENKTVTKDVRTATNGSNTVKMPALPNAKISNDITRTAQPVNDVKTSPVPKSETSTNAVAKKEGTIRIGIPTVKAGAVGEGVNAPELAGAIQNTLSAYLKGTKIELVPIEAKLASSQAAEIAEKQCDFVLTAIISHKKGGGGFGKMFGSVAPILGAVVPVVGVAGIIAGSVAGTAASATSNVKPKDEITLDLQINSVKDNASAFAKQYKAKAKKGSEDIISPMIEQAAQEILTQMAK
jgi:hypothetical protein